MCKQPVSNVDGRLFFFLLNAHHNYKSKLAAFGHLHRICGAVCGLGNYDGKA